MDYSRRNGKIKTKLLNCAKLIKKFKYIAAPVGLLVTLTVYTIVGGLIFQQLELPSEIIRLGEIRETIFKQRRQLMTRILNNTDIQRSNLAKVLQVELLLYEVKLQQAIQHGLVVDSFADVDAFNDVATHLPPMTTDRWSVLQAVFFASTVLTTIGYGNVVPTTHSGRIFCIFFAFVGIPLTLTVIANWGKLFAEAVSQLTRTIRHANVLRFGNSWIPQNITGRRSLGALTAISLLSLYLACGAAMFMLWEKDWGFFDGFYFCFITMTTIGFGDLVPKKPKYMLFCTLYILVGLALTGTIIELVRRQYAQSWQRLQALSGPLAEALRKLGEQAGDDVSALQSDLKKLLTVITMPKFKTQNGIIVKFKDREWKEVIGGVVNDISLTSNNQDQRSSIVQIIIYESSV